MRRCVIYWRRDSLECKNAGIRVDRRPGCGTGRDVPADRRSDRLKIIAACLRAPMCVSYIAARYGLAQTLVSRHLRLLRAARGLRADRCGKQIFCVATDEHVKRVISDMAEHECEYPPSEFDEPPKEE
ncbi:ArsR/SmtB family transcription factor [Paraburkholderia sp. UCT2]|uniref:ArsR/SmtB family transcription factor n=1 Tax=Paraburkholderia sp. UCT2 TaxID=2615208 RepID=UPI003975230B